MKAKLHRLLQLCRYPMRDKSAAQDWGLTIPQARSRIHSAVRKGFLEGNMTDGYIPTRRVINKWEIIDGKDHPLTRLLKAVDLVIAWNDIRHSIIEGSFMKRNDIRHGSDMSLTSRIAILEKARKEYM